MVTLTILLHPPEKSRVGRVRIIIKYYCQHHRRRRGKKTRCLVCVCVCIIHESCAVRSLNRKFKTKKCKKNFYYTTRVPTVLLQSNFEFRKTVKSCLIVFNEPLTQTTLNKNIVLKCIRSVCSNPIKLTENNYTVYARKRPVLESRTWLVSTDREIYDFSRAIRRLGTLKDFFIYSLKYDDFV